MLLLSFSPSASLPHSFPAAVSLLINFSLLTRAQSCSSPQPASETALRSALPSQPQQLISAYTEFGLKSVSNMGQHCDFAMRYGSVLRSVSLAWFTARLASQLGFTGVSWCALWCVAKSNGLSSNQFPSSNYNHKLPLSSSFILVLIQRHPSNQI